MNGIIYRVNRTSHNNKTELKSFSQLDDREKKIVECMKTLNVYQLSCEDGKERIIVELFRYVDGKYVHTTLNQGG